MVLKSPVDNKSTLFRDWLGTEQAISHVATLCQNDFSNNVLKGDCNKHKWRISNQEQYQYIFISKRKYYHFDDFLVTGRTNCCHFDNSNCSHWPKFHQNDISVLDFQSHSLPHAYIRSVVPETGTNDRDRYILPTVSVGCNYLYLSLIPASGTYSHIDGLMHKIRNSIANTL